MTDMTSAPAELTAWLAMTPTEKSAIMAQAKPSKNLAVYLRRCLSIVRERM